jgi:hypothetical protein
MVKVSGSVVLTAGQHVRNMLRLASNFRRPLKRHVTSPPSRSLSFSQDIVVNFFQGGVGAGLILYWSGPGVPQPVAIPASAFRCNPVANR